MLRKPELTVIGLSPSFLRSASSLYMQRRAFSFTCAALSLPPLKLPLDWSTNSLQLKWSVEPSDCSSASSFGWVLGPALPSAVRPYAAWNRFTAASVPGPKSPSTPTRLWPALSAAQPAILICSSVTSAPLSPWFMVRDHE